MKTLLYLLICCTGSAATIHEQFAAIARGADRVELTWRPELHVETAGLTPIKKIYVGAAIEAIVARLQFASDVSAEKNEESVPEDGKGIRIPNCQCSGTHLLRFFSQSRHVAEVAYLHGLNLRSKFLDEGRDAALTDTSEAWLQAEADWKSDVAKFEDFQKKKKNPNYEGSVSPKRQSEPH